MNELTHVGTEYNDTHKKDFPVFSFGELRGKWSGSVPPPAIGTVVHVKFNELGNGTVVGYFVESGWLGVRVFPDNPPKWWVESNKKRNDTDPNYSVFGAEINILHLGL